MIKCRVRELLVAALALPVVSSVATGQYNCSALQESDRKRLTEYLQRRYDVPSTAKLAIGDVTPIADNCMRKLTFTGSGPLGQFTATMFLSPDLRYLSPEVFDTHRDPVEEAVERSRKVLGELLEGEYASRGSHDARVTLVVFSDFQCPFCRQLADAMRTDDLINNGDLVRVVFRHMPLPNHKWAHLGAEAAGCAQFQSEKAFWRMHDAIFAHQSDISESAAASDLNGIAKTITDLDQMKFRDCMDHEMSLGTVIRDRDLATRIGVNATPTVFINGKRADLRSATEIHSAVKMALDTVPAETRRGTLRSAKLK